MKLFFVDTAGWMALVDERDPAHEGSREARDEWLRSGGVLVTSDYVVDETLTLLKIRLGLHVAWRWWEAVDSSQRLRLESVSAERASRARTWFFGWRDKGFSFTDCTSFALMRELRMRTALTSDRHFVQAGFDVAP